MRKLLIIILLIGGLSGCLTVHNTDGKTRPDEKQHAAHVASYNKCMNAIESMKASERHHRTEMEVQADDAWASRDLSWGDYQRHVTKDYYWETAEVVPVKTASTVTKPPLSKPKQKRLY